MRATQVLDHFERITCEHTGHKKASGNHNKTLLSEAAKKLKQQVCDTNIFQRNQVEQEALEMTSAQGAIMTTFLRRGLYRSEVSGYFDRTLLDKKPMPYPSSNGSNKSRRTCMHVAPPPTMTQPTEVEQGEEVEDENPSNSGAQLDVFDDDFVMGEDVM
jgi:hypothetical protein